MNTLNTLYENILGITFELHYDENEAVIILEMGNISFTVYHHELSNFVKSIEDIIENHKTCTCPTNMKNKIVIYEIQDIEVRMKLSYEELFQLRDLLKGTEFKLEMDQMLNNYNIL